MPRVTNMIKSELQLRQDADPFAYQQLFEQQPDGALLLKLWAGPEQVKEQLQQGFDSGQLRPGDVTGFSLLQLQRAKPAVAAKAALKLCKRVAQLRDGGQSRINAVGLLISAIRQA
jgi:hypothetical protein